METNKDNSQYSFGKVERFDQCHNLASYFEMHCLNSKASGQENDIAAIHNDCRITFYDLNNQANTVARNILKFFNSNEKNWKYFHVGIFLDEGFKRLITILSCLKLGLVIVPVSTSLNSDQLKQMIRSCNISLIIHDNSFIDLILDSETENEVEVMPVKSLLVNSDWIFCPNILNHERLVPHSRDNPVVILTTSGSSGTPKVLTLTNCQIFNRLFWQWRYLPYKTNEVICHRTNFMFVDNIVECLSSLLSGATMVIVSPVQSCDMIYLSKIIETYKVTWLLTVPSLLQKWMNQINVNPEIVDSLITLSTVVASGEMLFPRVAKRFFEDFNINNCRLVNLYGSTEVCGDVCCEILMTLEDVDKHSKNGFLSVGLPISNNKILISSDLENEGEVIVVGENVSPNCGHSFETGDVGFIDDKKLYICGRMDDMVKINGKKVFMKDVTAAVMLHCGVENCFTVHLMNDDKSHLVSFVSLKNKNINKIQAKNEIINNLLRTLPGIILPRLEYIDSIPMQSQSMKPDRKLLSSIASKIIFNNKIIETKSKPLKNRSRLTKDFQKANLDETLFPDSISNRKLIFHILVRHLAKYCDDITESTNFYEIGGDSIAIVICIADLNRKGFFCTTEVFLYNFIIGDIIDSILLQSTSVCNIHPRKSLTEFINNNFIVEPIEGEYKDEIIGFLVKNFYTKDLLVKYLNVSVQVFVDVVSEIYDWALQSRCSFCIRDLKSNAILAVQLSEDCSNYMLENEDEHFEVNPENILQGFLYYCKPRTMHQLRIPKLCVLIVALSNGLKSSSAIQLLYFIEKYTIDLAKRHNFKTIETINTSEATKKICSELTYKLIQSTSLNGFAKHFKISFLEIFNYPDLFGHYMNLDL